MALPATNRSALSSWHGRAVFPALMLLTACATVPDLGATPPLRGAETLTSAGSFSGAADGIFPTDKWWQSLGDPALTQLIDAAISQSPTIAIAQARIRTAEAMLVRANATANDPIVTLDASGGAQRPSGNQGFPPGLIPGTVRSQGRIAGTVAFDPDIWGRNRAALAAATSDADAARVDAEQARLMLTTGIAATYVELARLYAQRDVASDAVRIARETAILSQARNRAGLDSMGATNSALARQAGAIERERALDAAIALTGHALAELTGAGPDRALTIARPTLNAASPPTLPANLSVNLIARRPDIQAARLRAESAAARIGVARADFYPSVNLMAVAGLQSIGIGSLLSGSSFTGNIGPSLRLPIFSERVIAARYRGARAEYDIARAQYDAALTAALREVADAITTKRALTGQIASATTAVTQGEAAEHIAELRYTHGLANQLPLLAAEDATIAAKQRLETLQSDNLAADIALIRALGGGYGDE